MNRHTNIILDSTFDNIFPTRVVALLHPLFNRYTNNSFNGYKKTKDFSSLKTILQNQRMA
ncbi:hypothetical protein FM106_11720 [Brachybacterium faecium]|nr:hypothetical protein FM106_11720 [Brachybacterium faecium]